jgi:nucleotide-binding universal stress UspA family protein
VIHRILVSLDGSGLADEAIPWADVLAGMLGAEIDLLQVIERDRAAEALEGEVGFNERLQGRPSNVSEHRRTTEYEEPEREARSDLSRAQQQFQQATKIAITVIVGSAAETIVAHANDTCATLIAMASHGRTGVARSVLGSVAHGVISRSTVPVLVVTERLRSEPHAPRRVLIPLDMSAVSESAVHRLAPWARELSWQLVLFSAVNPPPTMLPVQGAAIPLGLPPDHPPAEHVEYLERLVEDLDRKGVEAEAAIASGDAADAIVGAVEPNQIGLIAMSTHARQGVGRLFLGSVTEAVIGRATVPVLVLRPEERQAREEHVSLR